MESGPQTQESSVVATSQDMAHTNKTLPLSKMATELNTAAESSNWTLVNDLLSVDGVCRCDVEQRSLLHKLAAAPEVSLSLARDILTKILKHTVDINMADTNDDTAVVVAARCDNTKMVMELLSRQAALPPDVTHVCSFLQTLTNNWKPQETPYMHALVVKLLWDRLQDTALHSCHKQLHHTLVRLAVTFHTSLVREMFVTEQQVNSVDSEGMAVLHRLAMFDSDDYVRVVLFLIIKGADVNLQNKTGYTPLHVAVKHNNWNMMEVLLHRRGKSDVMDCEQRSVLHIVASFSDPVQFPNIDQILPLLIRNNNDINKKDGEGNTALHLAALAGNIRFMKTLLDHGARADGVNKEQKTVLHMMATAKNNTSLNVDSLRKVLSLIVKKGAAIQKTDCAGNSVLHLAAKHGNWTLVEFLLKYVDEASQPDSEGFNILHRFAMRRYSAEMFFRLTHKVGGLNSKCHLGDSAIHLTAKCQNWDIVKLLVKEGAKIDELDNEGFHVLHKMAMGESVDKDLLSLFLTNSFNFNISCLSGDTVVHMAARHNNWSMVECLIEHVENIDEVDSEGLAVIQRLVLSTKGKLLSHFSLFSRLIELGADYTCRDKNGDTVLHLAARNDHWDIVQYLVQLGEGTDSPDSEGFVLLHRASVRGIPDSSVRELFHSILKCKPDLDKRTKQGDTAIHLAAKHDQWEVVMILIENSANIFDCDSEDTSVLQRMLRNRLQNVLSIVQLKVKETATEQDMNSYKKLAFEAASCGNWDVVKFLVDQGVSTHHVDSHGLSFLHNIAKGKTTQCQHENLNQLLKVLLEKNMDLEGKCPLGNSPLHLAAKYDNWEVVRHLLLQGASIHSPDSEGVFVIQRLAMYSDYHERHRDILKHLIKIGADLKVRCTNGDSLLHLGAKANNWLFVSHIIQEEINLDLDELDSDGFNILHRLAQDEKHPDWVKEFVMFGLNLDIPCGNGDTCLLLAAKRQNWTFVNRLLTQTQKPSCSVLQNLSSEALNPISAPGSSHFSRVQAKINIDTRDRRGYTVWHHAVMKKQLVIIFELLNRGANISNIDDEGLNLLQRLVSDNIKGIENVMTFLREKGFRFTQKDKLGNNILQVAAKNGNLPLVAHFLDHVKDIRSKDSDGLPLLHRVLNIIPDSKNPDNNKIVERLLKSGGDPKEMSWDGNTPLDLAAKKNRWVAIELLLRYGARTFMCDSEGLSVLHRFACLHPNRVHLIQTPFGPKFYLFSPAEAVKDLIQRGASMKQKDLQGNTPIHLAVQHQNWTMAQDFVQCGAQVNELDPGGYTVLHRLAKTENPSQSFLSLLIEKGVRCDIMSAQGETICEIIAENENWDMMKILLTHGTLAISEHDGKSLLHRLASSYHRKEQTNVFDLLIEKGLSVEAEDLDGNTLIHLAVRAGNWNLVEHLLQKGANGKQLDDKGLTLLHRFVSDVEGKFYDTCTLGVILSSGVDLNATDPQGNTALHIAAKRRLTVIVSLLIDKVDNLNSTDSDGFTVLLRLSQTPSSECLSLCQRLVEKGVDINTISTHGESALELAVKSSNWPVVDFLLSKGAQVNLENLEQLHVIHRLIKCSSSSLSDDDQLKLMKMLKDRGMSTQSQDSGGRTPAKLAFVYTRWTLFKYLLETGVQLNPFSRKGNSFFHEFVRNCSVPHNLTDITRHLTDIGMDINIPNRVGDTPVHVAADEGKWYIVKTFVEHGADTNMPDRKGFCLLHKLAKKSRKAYYLGDSTSPCVSSLEMLKTLVEHKADVNIRCPENKTALQIAASREDWEIVGGFVEVGAVCELTQAEKQSALENLHCLLWKDLEDHTLQRLVECITNESSYTKTSLDKNKHDDRSAALRRCVENSNWRMAKALVECGAEMTEKKDDKPLLHIMVSKYSPSDHAPWTSLLDLLLAKGLDINSRVQDGCSVLFHPTILASLISKENDAPCLCEILLEKGADPLVVNSDGFSLLRVVLDFSQQHTLNALKRLFPTGVTTHQTRLTKATLPSRRTRSQKTTSPVEIAIQGHNLCAVRLLIESGASSNAELFRLNTEYQVKLAGQADTDDNVRELLEVLNMAASQPRSLKSLCRLAVSQCVNCGPGRSDRIRSLPIPPKLQEFILFADLLSQEVLTHELVDLQSSSSEDNENDSSDESYYYDSDDDEYDEASLMRLLWNSIQSRDSDTDSDY